jgi:hydroxymethylbilane synthase
LSESLPSALRIGTRGSALARSQAEFVARRLREGRLARRVDLVPIVTHGDREAARPIADVWGAGVFTREIDRALFDGHIDVAVHSLKDLPVARPHGLCLAAVPTREDPRDVLISVASRRLADLPPNSVLATSSPRRRVQLAARRSDLLFQDLRGNVDTRIRAVRDGHVAAIVVARAGVARLGRVEEIAEVFDATICTPAPGQGALAIEVRADDAELCTALADCLDDPHARMETESERSFLAALGGGCRVPVGALARVHTMSVRLLGMIANPATGEIWRGESTGSAGDSAALGRALAASVPERVRAWAAVPEWSHERPHAGA